ncbi:MAG: DNA-binding protein WhiA [Cyanobacteriota bacterium]
MNNTYSFEIKENIFSNENLKKIKKECCIKNIFLGILNFRDSKFNYKNTNEIKFEEKILNNVFEYCLEMLNIEYEKAQIVHEKKSMIFFSFKNNIDNEICLNKCCKINFLKTAFICGGYVSNPEKGYHLEILSYAKNNIEIVKDILEAESLSPKCYIKNADSEVPFYVLYIKKSEEVTHFLGLIGANKQVLDFENTKIEKDFKNKITRQVNYESANIEKTINSSVKYIKAIEWAIKNGIFNDLSNELKEVALLRLNYPEHNLRELCEIYNNDVTKSEFNDEEIERYNKTYETENKFLTKSGINHRLRKLYVIIQEEIKNEF